MFILKNYNCGQQSMGNEVLSHALNSETNAIAETSNPGSQLMGDEVLSHALNSETAAIAETLNSEVNAIVETSNSANASPGDLIGWRDTPITEIDIRSFNPFRFSSEYHDDELSLIYYNYRHYDPATGRFLSRDPIEEQGGTNLYNFLENDGVNWIDSLGLSSVKTIYFYLGHLFNANMRTNELINKSEGKLKNYPYNDLEDELEGDSLKIKNKNKRIRDRNKKREKKNVKRKSIIKKERDMFHKQKECYISCNRVNTNNKLEDYYPNRTLKNPKRKNNLIYPSKVRDVDFSESVTFAIDNELTAAEEQAKSWCSEDGNKCKKVEVKVKRLDDYDGSVKKYMQKKGWSENSIIKEWSCEELNKGK